MRKLFAAVTVLGLVTAAAVAADKEGIKKEDSSKEPEPKALKVGDKAPQLTVSKWMHGKAVSAFTPGKTYVVEFWATWCGPCVIMMPHLGELQAEFKDKGLTVIGYTTKDPMNTEQKVADFVAKRGPKLGYTFAYGDGPAMDNAWMNAAHQDGIPCSFVVDPNGKLAYIGHPMFLGVVLPKVIAGNWNAEQGDLEVAEAKKELQAAFRGMNGPTPEESLKTLTEFETKRPELAKLPFFVSPKIMLLLRAKKLDEAKKLAGVVLAKAIEQDDAGGLRTVANICKFRGAKEQKDLTDLSLKAADALLKVSGDKDLGALVTAAEVNFATGNKAKAKEYGKKALAAAADQPKGIRTQVERLVEKYDDAKETDGKKETKKEDK
jgi:thiol-disulfide isomerase/thioredoxin